MLDVLCHNCGHRGFYSPDEVHSDDVEGKAGSFIDCDICGESIPLTTEYLIENNITNEQITESLPVLKEGTVVVIDNAEHPLHNQIGIICDKKHKHYRVELEQKKIWVPEHWVKYNEHDGTD